jgi:hypothetical protein
VPTDTMATESTVILPDAPGTLARLGQSARRGGCEHRGTPGDNIGGEKPSSVFPRQPRPGESCSRCTEPAHDSHAAVDPVCRMHVKPETEAAHLLVRDTTHYFLLARLCPGSHREPRELCSVVKHRMMHRRPTAVWHRRTSRLLWHCNHPTDRHCLLAECMHVSVSAGPDDAARERRGRCGLWLRGAGT